MRALAGVAVLAVAVSLTACQPRHDAAPADRLARGSSSHSITVDDRERTFGLYAPRSLPSGSAVPLVVMLHGGFGTGAQAQEAYGWDEEADRGGFVVAYPDGLNRAWAVGAGCCGQPGRQAVDDVAFVEAVVAAVGRLTPIDPARVYATGMSNGALLSYRLACDSRLFAAIAPVAGTQLGDCAPPAPVSVLHVHGGADANVAFDGSPGAGVAKIDGPPVPEVLAGWRAIGECGEPVVTVDGEVTTSSSQCANGREVELVLVAGAGHQWPGSRPKTAVEKLLGLDPPSDALDATAVIWRFFAAHPRPAV
ncbi:polyhydroxybutyrate depolymerase [Allocatelliglobosispora scoriae]|uniref:Polyhydroxybutyrate depolymerase n=1 Tax=Allocatelliglobosispora scoriae TaxID=643052 RepID=A0A841BPS2_9ACTN|nr:PHB depolymerase family esterase [Allocatelliglobosispora scoriae]MBB5868831.1 polyhydroxybutyrate depolymerase [Allocatelliglobosispora scoriae]